MPDYPTISLDDFAPATPTTRSTTRQTRNFMNQQFALFQLPVCAVYLKGSMPALADTATLADALTLALVRPLGGPKHKSIADPILDALKVPNYRALLYTKAGKEFHLNLVNECLAADLVVSPTKALSYTYACNTLQAYLVARTAHYTALGFSSLESWLGSLPTLNPAPAVTQIDLDSLDWPT